MILHTSKKIKIIPYLLFFAFFSCKKVSSKENLIIHKEEKEIKKTEKNTWKLEKIFSVSPQSNYSCSSEKYNNLVFGLNSDSVFINNKYTDDVYTNSVASKSYFKQKYLYETYKKRLKEELNIDLPEMLKSIRNKKAYDKTSPLDEYFQDAFFIDEYIFFEDNGCIISFKNTSLIKENKKTAKSSFISEDKPSRVSLPFSFHQYFKDQYSEIKYPSYELNENLIDFLKSKNYDGETYKGFVIRSDNDFEFLLVIMVRGDSEYFILITSANHKIIDYKEIGAIGDENPVTFKINQDFSIEKYHGNNENSIAFEKYQIDYNGNIQKK